MFTHNCCILKYDKQLLQSLRLLGYTLINVNVDPGCLFTTNTFYGESLEDGYFIPSAYNYRNTELIPVKQYINCIFNRELFLLTAAIREGSDKWQMFTNGTDFKLCTRNDFKTYMEYSGLNPEGYRKATVAEIRKLLTNNL